MFLALSGGISLSATASFISSIFSLYGFAAFPFLTLNCCIKAPIIFGVADGNGYAASAKAGRIFSAQSTHLGKTEAKVFIAIMEKRSGVAGITKKSERVNKF